MLQEFRVAVVRTALALVEQRERENDVLVADNPGIRAELAARPGVFQDGDKLGFNGAEEQRAQCGAADGRSME